MKMKLNRITMSLAGALFVFALISCDLEVPSSVKVQSKPGLYVSLGSPFAGSDEMSLSQYLSVDGLKEQLGGDIDILEWEYPSDTGVQAYRVRYPVADININLSEYVAELDVASNLSGASGQWIPGTGSEIEIPLPLDSMSFAHDVTKVKISVTLKFAETTDTTPPTTDGETNVPDGVTVTFKGDEITSQTTQDGNKWTSPEITTFDPATDKISIAVTVPQGYWFKVELGFDWDSAKITLEGGETTREGSYDLDFTSFSEFMGEGISLADVSGYLYLQNELDISPTLKLTWDEGSPDDITSKAISEALVWDSFTDPDPDKKIDLTNLFTKKLTFSYELNLSNVTINKTAQKKALSADMVILLPLEFTLDGDKLKSDFDGYRKLDLEALRGLSDGSDGDLLGRKSASDQDSMFKDLKSAKIWINDYRNDMIGGLAFGVLLKNGKTQVLTENDLATGSAKISLDTDDLAYPFNPKFELLVPDAGTLKILKKEEGKDATIDFSIAVEATTDLDYQVVKF